MRSWLVFLVAAVLFGAVAAQLCEDNQPVAGSLCKTCNAGECEECIDGHDDVESGCVKCASEGYYNKATGDNEYDCVECKNNCENEECGDDKTAAYYDAENKQCVACDEGCAACTAEACSQCKETYYNKATDAEVDCEECQSDNCAIETCGDETTAAYYDAENKKCELCPNGCGACTAIDVCSECKEGFYDDGTAGDNKNCVDCDPACKTCSGPETCTSCAAEGYYNKATGEGEFNCVACKNNCENEECGDDKTVAYYDADNKQCVACALGCAACTADGCSECKDGFYDSGKGGDFKSCEQCDSACKDTCEAAGPEGCDFCADEYYRNQVDNQCTSCEDSEDCKTCGAGYFKVNSESDCILCDTNDENCKQCNNEYFKVEGNPVCFKCIIDYCEVCSSFDVCAKCADGYYFEKNAHECTLCDEECATCTGAGPDKCTTCKPNRFENPLFDPTGPENHKCIESCPADTENVKWYADGQKCLNTCPAGKYGDDNLHACQPCDGACATCTGSGNGENCVECASPYVENPVFGEESPVKCLDACPEGYYKNGQHCVTECPTGTFLDGDNCVQCDDGCATCAKDESDDVICSMCDEHHFVADPAATVFVCTECTGDNHDVCVCGNGMYLDTTTRKCVKCTIANCARCANSNKCETCEDGFVRTDAGVCEKPPEQNVPSGAVRNWSCVVVMVCLMVVAALF